MAKVSDVEVVEFPKCKVIGLREKGSYAKIREMIPKLCTYMISKNIKFAGFPIFVCHENSNEEAFKADKDGAADLEICIPIEEAVRSEGEFKVYDLPRYKMAKITRTGPYVECEDVWKKLHTWMAENNYKVVGNTREVYLNNPVETKESELITEIYTPIGTH